MAKADSVIELKNIRKAFDGEEELNKKIASSRRKDKIVEVVADTSSSYNSGKVK